MEKNSEKLLDVALSWVGTPWVDNSASKGRGACCHLLVAEIYRESGWLDLPPFDSLPRGIATAARWSNRSPMLEWLRGPGAQWFDELPDGRHATIQPGDLLLLKYGHVPHHLALVLPGARVVHVTHRQGVEIVPMVPAHSRILANLFRPR